MCFFTLNPTNITYTKWHLSSPVSNDSTTVLARVIVVVVVVGGRVVVNDSLLAHHYAVVTAVNKVERVWPTWRRAVEGPTPHTLPCSALHILAHRQARKKSNLKGKWPEWTRKRGSFRRPRFLSLSWLVVFVVVGTSGWVSFGQQLEKDVSKSNLNETSFIKENSGVS